MMRGGKAGDIGAIEQRAHLVTISFHGPAGTSAPSTNSHSVQPLSVMRS